MQATARFDDHDYDDDDNHQKGADLPLLSLRDANARPREGESVCRQMILIIIIIVIILVVI